MNYALAPLPIPYGNALETVAILKQAIRANKYLAELKGISKSIPNQNILINTLSLQEAKDSSAIESIITTHDELFKEELFPEVITNPATKEVLHYISALQIGYQLVKEQHLLTSNHILQIHVQLENNKAGFRKLPGTTLKNNQGETVYTPPQDPADIVALMDNLEKFINDENACNADPLVKMAIIHYQFESIHPFYDGNGRTGRIINVLYLVTQGLLEIPILYLSRHIIQNKQEYYRLLQAVREENAWEEWILFMLTAVEQTAQETIRIMGKIKDTLQDYKQRIRLQYKFYSHDLINNLFSHPYTKIEFIMRDMKVSRLTATKYLDALAEGGFLNKRKIGRSNYYVNTTLFRLLADE